VRGEQIAALETEYHALLTAPKISRLLERALAMPRASKTGSLPICVKCAGSGTMASQRRRR